LLQHPRLALERRELVQAQLPFTDSRKRSKHLEIGPAGPFSFSVYLHYE